MEMFSGSKLLYNAGGGGGGGDGGDSAVRWNMNIKSL
jgi:hypothetical protein